MLKLRRTMLLLTKILGAIAGILIIVFLATTGWEKYKIYSWEPPNNIDGVSLGMSKSDVLFKRGPATECSELPYQPSPSLKNENSANDDPKGFDLATARPVEELCEWRDADGETFFFINFEAGRASHILKYSYSLGLPFSNVEEMRKILGTEDIMSSSDDSLKRQYTYADSKFSFIFKTDRVYGIRLADSVIWRQLDGRGEYFVRGRQICPSDVCPFDPITGDVLPYYEGKSFRYFLPKK